MDDWTYPYTDVDEPDTQQPLLNEDWRLMEARRARTQQAEADRRAADLEQSRVWDRVDDRRTLDVPLPFEATAHTSLTY